MNLDRRSVLVGIGIAIVGLGAATIVPSAAQGSWWPWSNDRPEITVTVRGSIDCSQVIGDGFGASAGGLKLTANGVTTTLTYPFKLRDSRVGSIFRPPSYGYYERRVKIGKNKDNEVLSWELSCVDAVGNRGGTYHDSFSVSRKDLSRTICANGGGVFAPPCTGPGLNTRIGNCLTAFLPASRALDVLDAVDLITAPEDMASYGSVVERLVKEGNRSVGTAFGIAFSCFKPNANNAEPRPAPIPTIPPLPGVTRAPIEPLPTVQPPTPARPAPNPPPATPVVGLAQGPAAPSGYRYAITLTGFSANTGISIACFDSVSPQGFYTFTLTTNSSGTASTASYCYSGDGPDHWVRANGAESNHVIWTYTPPPPVPPAPPTPSVTLGRGPTAPAGFRYAITLDHFAANTNVTVTCHDSVDPGGFYTFTLRTDGGGHAYTASYCYSGDHPDHWAKANGTESNHVTW